MAEDEFEVSVKERQKPPLSWARAAPLLIFAAGLAAFFLYGLNDYLSFETLRDNKEALTDWVARYGVLAVLAYIATYIVVVAFSLPGGSLMSITGGFLFGWLWATIAIVIGATIGATALFLIAKTTIGDALQARAGDAIKKMERGFQEDAFNYLLVLRLLPLIPFFLVNLVPAFLGVPLRTYVTATFIGIIPGTMVYASVGNGLGAIFERGEMPDSGIIFEPQILLPILGIAALALLPIIYKKFTSAKQSEKA